MRTRTWLTAVTIGLAALGVMATPASAGDHTVTVSPSSDVPSGSSVAVSWTGATPSGDVAVSLCNKAVPQNTDCNSAAAVITTSDAAGSGTQDLTVASGAVGAGECTTECFVVVADFGTASTSAAAFTFAAPAQEPPGDPDPTSTTTAPAAPGEPDAAPEDPDPTSTTAAPAAPGEPDAASGELANTGIGTTGLLFMVGAALLAGGLALTRAGQQRVRRRRVAG